MARKRRSLDFGRLREALSGPGADPRTWCSMARIDNDPDAIRWETDSGWIVDVTFVGGPLDQEGPIPCRVLSSFAGEARGRIEPVARGAEVLVAIPEGDANANPVIIGQLFNGGGSAPPTAVNNVPINEALALVTHILKTPHAVREQAGALYELEATQIKLGKMAVQPVVQGTEFNAAMQSFLTALQTFLTSLLAPPTGPPPPVVAAAAGAFIPAVVNLSSTLPSTLSTKTFTE